MTRSERITQLIFQYCLDGISPAETIELNAWIEESEKNRLLFERLTDFKHVQSFVENKTKIEQQIFNAPTSKVTSIWFIWRRLTIPAAAIFLLAVGAYLFTNAINNHKRNITHQEITQSISDVPPGKFSAILKLSDGKQINLDSAGAGLLTKQGQTNILKKDGQIIYDGKGSASEILYNTLETVTGQTYAMTLSDGSKVWLNAKSSLKFPVVFNGTERSVEMQGEVYFEVAKNPKKPFKVSIVSAEGKTSEIEVLGTKFNVNAYADEPVIKTTLVEGSVKVRGLQATKTSALTKSSAKLIPGQQAQLDKIGVMQVIEGVNTEAYTAWTNQTFYFQNSDLKAIMRQLSRWYGIEVLYEKNLLTNPTLSGIVSRKRTLTDVLKTLEANNIHFVIEGNKLTIKP